MEGALFEREAELGLLRSWRAEAAGGSGRLVFISGEAGIGKSSLVRAFPPIGEPILTGRCDPLDTPRPLGPWQDLAAALGADLNDRPYEALLQALRRLEAGTVLILEDLHWADSASVDLLRFAGRRVGSLPIM